MIRSLARTGALASVAFLVTTALAAEPGPHEVVGHFHDVMLGVMRQSGELDYKQRFAKLEPALRESFDVEFMASKSIGSHWKDLSPADQDRWLNLFRRMTTANYAGRLTSFGGQHFEDLGDEAGSNETMLVRTRLIDPTSENVDLNYRLRKTDAGWKVIDIYLKGTVSELALRRSEYTSVLDREGFEVLVARIEKKIADFEAGRGG